MSEWNELPGSPRRRLVQSVRRRLRLYGIVPPRHLTEWHQTWEWAAKIANSYMYRPVWPTSYEIASQFMFLVLVKMREDSVLKLPPRAQSHVPSSIRLRIGGEQPRLTA